jgi:hypothetical protein
VSKYVTSVSVDPFMMDMADKDQIDRYVKSKLTHQLADELMQHEIIHSDYNSMTNQHTYTMSVLANSSNGITASNIGASSISHNTQSYSQINLRVVEYTKKGKVSRVELQKYDEINDSWTKIPRIQIEED